jgi:hypothetical protein
MRFKELKTGRIMSLDRDSIIGINQFTEVTIHRKGIPIKFLGKFINSNDEAITIHELVELDNIVKRRINASNA